MRIHIPPSPKLMESMRALGYTPDVAVADIIDNSLDADARLVHVRGDVSDSPSWLWVFDDGTGMTLEEMADALKLATVSSIDERNDSDLGRFGLGLKTATFSQCRRLTLISRKHGETSGVCFDLDELLEGGEWTVRQLTSVEMETTPGFEQLDRFTRGTLVCWEKLDRLMESRSPGAQGMGEVLSSLKRHLGLTFHRWIEAGAGSSPRLELLLNGHRVRAIDPFIRHNRAVEMTEPETVHIGGSRITVQAFTLPHSTKITGEDAEREDLGEGMFRAQGFYFYRNRRLISHGGWATIGGRRDATKHSRIMIDLPNALDDVWQLDVMKNKVIPPAAVRRELARFYTLGGRRSGRVISYRGRRETAIAVEYAWVPVTERGAFRYEPNPEHPVVADALDDLSEVQKRRVLRGISHLGLLIPYGDIRRRMSVDDELPSRELPETLVRHAAELIRALNLDMTDRRNLKRDLERVEPFSGRRDLDMILEEAVLKLRGEAGV